MNYFIGPEGLKSSQIAIVAEKPGKDELLNLQQTGVGRPLIGASGKEVNNILMKLGSHRSQVYLTNAVKHFDALGTPTTADIKREQLDLYKELLSMPNLNCIVAMGKAALLSLTNFHLGGIEQWRGSIFPSFIGTKMTATYHPSHYMRGNWKLRPVVTFDLHRALQEAKFPEIQRQERNYYVRPSFQEAREWLSYYLGKKEIAFDVEGRRYLTAIGFSSDPSEAHCIPITREGRQPYWSLTEELEIWRLIQDVLNQPDCCYITQYGLSDCIKLYRHGIITPYMYNGFDTMYAHRLLAPDLPHGLDFLTSIYTDQFFYKDEAGDFLKEFSVSDNQFWVYNCKDCANTIEVAHKEREDLKQNGMYEYFMSDMQSRFNSLLQTQITGIKVDKQKLIETRNQLFADLKFLEEEMEKRLGWKPNPKSKKDMKRLLEDLNIRYDQTPTGWPKTNEERMLVYATRANEIGQQIIGMCLESTRRRTLVSNFFNLSLDKNDFYHPSLDLSHTKSGRDSSTGAEEGGPQIQNIPEFARRVFIADSDAHILMQADLERAEARVVAWDAEDELLISAFQNNKDIYRVDGCLLFRNWHSNELPPDDLLASITEVCEKCSQTGQKKCNHSERYISKQTELASNYMEGPGRLVVEFAKKGVFINEKQAKFFLSKIVSEKKKLWHERIKHQLAKSPWLVNHLGRKREFFGVLDSKMLRDALAWVTSSTISVIRDRAWNFLDKNLPPGCRLVTNTHDSILTCILAKREEECKKLYQEAFYQPLNIHGRELLIPIEIVCGDNWGNLK